MFTFSNHGDQGPNQYRTQDLVNGVRPVIFFEILQMQWSSVEPAK